MEKSKNTGDSTHQVAGRYPLTVNKRLENIRRYLDPNWIPGPHLCPRCKKYQLYEVDYERILKGSILVSIFKCTNCGFEKDELED